MGDDALTVDCEAETAPGFTTTAAVWVIATPLIVADTVLVSALVDATVPVATPEPLVVPTGCVSEFPVPLEAITTVAPAMGLPFASFAVTVTVEPVPPAVMGEAADTVDWVAETGPAVPVTEKLTGLPVRPVDVAVTVLTPAVVPSVQVVSVACPEPSVVIA